MFDRPATVSNATTPKAKTSAFSVRWPLMAYSGARYPLDNGYGDSISQIRIQSYIHSTGKGEMHLQCARNFGADMSLLLIKEFGEPEIGDLGCEVGVK